MKLGLVLEGGGMRGLYTCGVLDCFLDHHLLVDYVIGVSAGASSLMKFLTNSTPSITKPFSLHPVNLNLG